MIYCSRFPLPSSRFAFYVRGSVLAAATMGILATGCAAKGPTVATPRPFPGAAVPPRSAPALPSPEPLASDGAIHPAVISLALSLHGTPYRNGGSDPSGFDCSGFVQWVFAQQGLALPREVRQQYLVGEEIESDEVRPGDLCSSRPCRAAHRTSGSRLAAASSCTRRAHAAWCAPSGIRAAIGPAAGWARVESWHPVHRRRKDCSIV